MIPEMKQHVKYMIQTAVFGNVNDRMEPDITTYVSHFNQHIANKYGKNYHVINNPIEQSCSELNLRDKLNISDDTFVFGHIGRFDINTYSNINLEAYSKIENEKTCFVWLPENELVLNDINRLDIKNYRLIEKTFDQIELSKFYNTINVLAHSRKDGECDAAVISEAFAHKKPVISHYGQFFNGHIKQIGNAGFVTKNINEYTDIMNSFVNNKVSYDKLSKNSYIRWEKYNEPNLIANKYYEIYKKLN